MHFIIDVVFGPRCASSVAARRARAPRMGIAHAPVAIGLCAALLAGCGQKGPLVLPKTPAAAASAASAPS